ncbi:hypothetical protein VPARA_53260 [Variovorax paradoxus]|uniref:Uncharacterized protein n=1 Tax=Variovorax paradoxus TaxID=34073 RepID=A0A0H2LYI3_VARPD|nr:hypothetical protein VPARA_53260 [Variovorax paradoxus]
MQQATEMELDPHQSCGPSLESGFSRRCWIVRLSGRARNTGSKPTLSISTSTASVDFRMDAIAFPLALDPLIPQSTHLRSSELVRRSASALDGNARQTGMEIQYRPICDGVALFRVEAEACTRLAARRTCAGAWGGQGGLRVNLVRRQENAHVESVAHSDSSHLSRREITLPRGRSPDVERCTVVALGNHTPVAAVTQSCRIARRPLGKESPLPMKKTAVEG